MKSLCFAEQLGTLRTKQGLTQKALAEELKISPKTVSQWEKGNTLPSVEQALALAERFGLSVEELFYEKEEAPAKKAGMESLRELYKVGSGPSSSHTMGPEKACRIFREKNPSADEFAVTLYGSLAKTGEGHGTDRVILKTLAPLPCHITFDTVTSDLPHPNTMRLFAYEKGNLIDETRVFSVGGGAIRFEGEDVAEIPHIYDLHTFNDISDYCKANGLRLWEYVYQTEGEGFREYLLHVWNAMKRSIAAGLEDEGILPGGLNVHKKAKHLYN